MSSLSLDVFRLRARTVVAAVSAHKGPEVSRTAGLKSEKLGPHIGTLRTEAQSVN